MMRADTGSAITRVTQMDFDQGSPKPAAWIDDRGESGAGCRRAQEIALSC